MRVVKHFLNEKFEQNTDPIRDMGIGIIRPRDFKNVEELYDFLGENIFAIIGQSPIPDKFITTNGGAWSMDNKYADKIERFIKKYVTIRGRKPDIQNEVFFVSNLYKRMYESLNEKFTEQSDAIHDMGIGMEKIIRDFMKNDIEEYQNDDDENTTNKDIILGYAVAYEREDIVDYLLGKGANINNKHVNDWFKFGCKWGHDGMIKLLLDRDFNFHGSPGEGNEKGLRIAIANDKLPVVKLLVEAGADPEAVQGKPIRIAIANNHMDVIKYLKEKGYKLGTWEYFQVADKAKIRAMTDFIGQELKAEKKRKIRKFFGLKEGLYEKFEETSDPVADLGVGIISQLKKDSLKVRKHQSTQGYRIAAYMSHISMVSEENLYLIDHNTAHTLLEKSEQQEFIGDMESGFGIEFSVFNVLIDKEFDGVILKERNAFSATYWGNLKAALKAYELENLTKA